MRNKNKQFRIDSAEVQGEGSYVVVKSPSWGLLRKAQRLTADGSTDVAQNGVEFAEELVVQSVLDWNWTDDNDQPLPPPAHDKNVVELLTAEEMTFLVERITNLVGNSGN